MPNYGMSLRFAPRIPLKEAHFEMIDISVTWKNNLSSEPQIGLSDDALG